MEILFINRKLNLAKQLTETKKVEKLEKKARTLLLNWRASQMLPSKSFLFHFCFLRKRNFRFLFYFTICDVTRNCIYLPETAEAHSEKKKFSSMHCWKSLLKKIKRKFLRTFLFMYKQLQRVLKSGYIRRIL